MKSFRWLLTLSLLGIFIIMSDAYGDTYSLNLRYKPGKDFPLLKEKIGPHLGLAPFKDERKETLYRLTPEGMEKTCNEILTEIFDSFFSNPY